MPTRCALNLQDALLGAGILKGVGEGRLDGEEGPLAVSGRAGGGRRAVDDGGIAALDGGAVDGEIEGRHSVCVCLLAIDSLAAWLDGWQEGGRGGNKYQSREVVF